MPRFPITAELMRALVANGAESAKTADGSNHKPVVKLFTPDANCTWLLTELADDGDTLFGLCDLGFGSPELGYVSLREITSVRGRMGLPVERDRHFKATKTISAYADEARQFGRIKA